MKPGVFASSRAPNFRSWRNVRHTCDIVQTLDGLDGARLLPELGPARKASCPSVGMKAVDARPVAMPERHIQSDASPSTALAPERRRRKTQKGFTTGAWEEARALIWTHRKRLALGLGLMLINRLSGLRPADDDQVPDGRRDRAGHTGTCCRRWRWPPARRRSSTRPPSFANSQVLGVAAQRAITEMRKDVEAHVMRLPIRYFDSTKTGILISRIMTDAEGIRNLVGTGLVQLTGSILTAVDRAVRPALSELAADAASRSLILGAFGGGMAHGVQAPAAAVPRARPDQRRSDRPARRIARRRPHRQGLHRGEARGAGVREGRAPAVPQRRASR